METALLKLTDDIFARFADHRSTILVALDQSAAFDCVDHMTLTCRLNHSFGVTGTTLNWISSHLVSRSRFVRWKHASSSVQSLETGVPQGSALGPLLFCLYIAPLSRVIRAHGINYHQYADDTQVYIAVSKSNFQVKLTQLETCTASVHAWLQMNGLQLNPNKSEGIQFIATRGRDRVEDVTSLQVSNAAIKPSSTMQSLGVTLDTKLSFDEHVTNVCRLCYGHIRELRHVRASLPGDVARIVACSIIGSRLDYCNSLLAGTSKSNLIKLERVFKTLWRE
jgi:Reverse transcriptase (RNA-dependent DNA polymerase)